LGPQNKKGVFLLKHILFVDCCLRGAQSRTRKLAQAFLESCLRLNPGVKTTIVDLDKEKPVPTDSRMLAKRDSLMAQWEDPFFAPARQFLDADLIVLAAPFWNGSFPALLHSYLEQICVPDLTFTCVGEDYTGLSQAKACVLITTRGGCYEHGSMLGPEHATPLVRSIMKMLGINRVETLAAEGIDLVEDPSPIIAEACRKAESLAEALS